MNQERLHYLFNRYLVSDTTQEEEVELSELVRHADEHQLAELLSLAWENMPARDDLISKDQADGILKQILATESDATRVVEFEIHKKRNWWKYLSAAAAVLLFAGAAYFLVFVKERKVEPTAKVQPTNDLLPGQSGAVLTLANGQKIILDSARNGLLATQGSSKVIHSNGEIRYQSESGSHEANLLNTITTPKGRQFQLLLSDGSKVWLNAASSITYPTAFNSSSRNVTISGEVYFEIARDQSKPFKISIDGREEVEVLGTHFNINAYHDEPTINTTLLEGSIKIVSVANGDSRILKPGQQARLNGTLDVKTGVDLDEVMAWKNGYFSFNGASTEAIMRQVTRWYDADVIYQGDVKDERFAGSVPRSENASKLLEVLELTKTLKFTIEGKKIIVTPYPGH